MSDDTATSQTRAGAGRQAIEDLVARHTAWRRTTLNLIASENILSPAVLAAMSSDLQARYADYPGRDPRNRRYRGNRYIAEIEAEAVRLASELLRARFVELRPIAGHLAGLAIVMAVCRPGVVLKYSEVFLPIRRINGQDIQLKGGYKPIGVIQSAGGDIPILEDIDCPNSRVHFVNTKYIKLIDLLGTEWADDDGAQFARIEDKDGIEGYLRKYWGLAWTRLNCHVTLSDVSDITPLDRW